MDIHNLAIVFLLIVFNIFLYKGFPNILKKYNSSLLIDDQFEKPQAFHTFPVSIIGGTGIFLSLNFVFFYFFYFENIIFAEYFSFCLLFYFLGFVDDLKININPKTRLILMIIFLIVLIELNDFYITKTGIDFLNSWLLHSELFSLVFMCLCFIFVINGANLIDGYNGLLGFHSLIIITNLFLINYLNENESLALLLFFQIIILVNFLIFNFPKAKIFLGDSGSYLLGVFISISVISTAIANPDISPFYFCILLFYLFFEVFFSFFRKLIKEKTSPIRPDKKHLHMLLYKILLEKNKNKEKSNFQVSIIINLIYLILTIPAVLMMNVGMFCKYYSLIFFIIYFVTYKVAYAKVK